MAPIALLLAGGGCVEIQQGDLVAGIVLVLIGAALLLVTKYVRE